MTTETYDKKPELPPLPKGVVLDEPSSLPPLPKGVKLDVEKKSEVGGASPTASPLQLNDVDALKAFVTNKPVEEVKANKLANQKQPTKITTSITQTKTQQPSEKGIDEEAHSKINSISDEDMLDPLKGINKQSQANPTNPKDILATERAKKILENRIAPDGFEAKEMLEKSFFGAGGEDNHTANVLREKAGKYEKNTQPLREIKVEGDLTQANDLFLDYNYKDKLYSAAVQWYAENNPTFKKELGVTGVDARDWANIRNQIPNGKMGDIMQQFTNDKDVLTYLQKENPSLIPAFQHVDKNLLKDNNDFAINQVANKVSKEVQKSGFNNIDPIFNFYGEGHKEYADQVAKSVLSPEELEVWNKNIKDNQEQYMDAPSLMQGVAEGGEGVFKGIANTFTEPFRSASESTKRRWEKESQNVSADPEGIFKVVRDTGHVIGLVGAIAGTGNVLGAGSAGLYSTRIVPALSGGVLPFLGDSLEEGRAKYPDSPVKAWTSALFNTSMYAALSQNLFQSKKIMAAINSVKPETNKIVERLASGAITKEAARQEANTAFKRVLDLTGGAAGTAGKITAELTAIKKFNTGLDKIMMDEQEFKTFHPEADETKETLGLFLSNIALGGFTKFGQMKNRNRVAEESYYEMASNPKKYEREINNASIDKSFGTIQEFKENLKHIAQVKKELDVLKIHPKDQKRFIFESLKEKIAKEESERSSDSTVKEKSKEVIKEAKDIKEKILAGEDAETIVTESEKKKIDEERETAIKLERLAKDNELDNKKLDAQRAGLDGRNPDDKLKIEEIEEKRKRVNEDYIKESGKLTPKKEQEVLSPEDSSLLSELQGNSSDIVKTEGLTYFIDKATEDPAAFMDIHGKKLTKQLLNKVPGEKLIKHRDYLTKNFGESESTDFLTQIISQREKEQPITQEYPSKLKVGETIQWDVYGNEENSGWTVKEHTKTRGGADAVVLTKEVPTIEIGKNGKEYQVGTHTQEHVVKYSDLNKKTPVTQETQVSEGGGENEEVLYHGAPKGVDELSFEHLGKTTDNPTAQWGVFFTPDKKEAQRYVDTFHNKDGNIIERSVKLKKPYEMSFREYDDIVKLDLSQKDATVDEQMNMNRQKAKEFKDKLVAEGYDGIVIGQRGKNRSQEVVAFDQSSITKKSQPKASEGAGEAPANVVPSLKVTDDRGVDGFVGKLDVDGKQLDVSVHVKPLDVKVDMQTIIRDENGEKVGEIWSTKNDDGTYKSSVNLDERIRGKNVYGKILDAIEKQQGIKFVPSKGELTNKAIIKFWDKRLKSQEQSQKPTPQTKEGGETVEKTAETTQLTENQGGEGVPPTTTPPVAEGSGEPPVKPPKPPIDGTGGGGMGDLNRLANNVPDSGKVAEYMSKDTIEKYTGETPTNDQSRGVQELGIALEHGEKIIEKAKEVFGTDYVDKTLDYIENSTASISNKALMYVSLENALGKEKQMFPERAAELTKQQALVYEQSQKFAREYSLALNYQKLRKIAQVGYDIEKVTGGFFSPTEAAGRKDIEKAVEADADTVNKEAENQEKGGMTAEVEKLVQEGVEKEINKIYEKLPKDKKTAADKAIAALEAASKKLRSRTYDAGLGIPVAIIDMGITTTKLAIKAGVKIVDAIELGIAKIKEKYGKELEKSREDNIRKDFTEVFSKIKSTTDFVKEALIEKGFGREITVKGEKKTILDWKKLAGRAGTVGEISKNVAEVMKDKGMPAAEVEAMKDALVKEYIDLRTSVIEKAQTELARRNKENVTPEQKSAARKLAELYTYGLFESKENEFDVALNKALGAKVSEKGYQEAKDIARAMETIYSSTFKGSKLNDVSAKAAIEKLEDRLRVLLFREARGQGNKNLRFATLVRNYFEVQQTMILNNLKQAVENPFSGFQQNVIDKISNFKSSTPEMADKRRKLMKDIYKDMLLHGGIGYGKVEATFVNRQHIDDYINKLSDNKLYHGIMSVATGKATLNAMDAMWKAGITEKKFAGNLMEILTHDTNPNKMSKADAMTFVSEKLTGQTFKDAQVTAKAVIEKINKDAGKELIATNNESVDRLANDIVKAALEMGGKLSKEDITAAYNAAYKAAGLGLGHQANNPLSGMITGYSAKIEGDINQAIRNKEWNRAAFLTYKSVLFRNILNPFVGGGTNWLVLKLEKTGLGLATGLAYQIGSKAKIDMSTELGRKKMEERLYNQSRYKDNYMRGLVGATASLLTYAAFAGIASTDDYRKWRGKNQWAARYLDIFTPEFMLTKMAIENDQVKKYVSQSFNKNDAFDASTKAIKALDYASKGKYNEAWGAFGEMVGGKANLPLPWRLVKDGVVIYQGIKGQDPYHGNYKPSTGFMNGVLQGGAIEFLGWRPEGYGESPKSSGSTKKETKPQRKNDRKPSKN